MLYRPSFGGGSDTHDGGGGNGPYVYHPPAPTSLKKKIRRVLETEKRVVVVHSSTLEHARQDFEQGKRDYDRIQAEILKIQENIKLLKLAPRINNEEDSRLLDDLRALEEQLLAIELQKIAVARALLDDELIIMLLSDQEIH